MGFRVIANDWEPYSEIINKAYIAPTRRRRSPGSAGWTSAFDALNALAGERGYIATHYCPADDENYDIARERMFYTQTQRPQDRRHARADLRDGAQDGEIDSTEEAVLLAPLIYQASYCSNTSGVFKGFHNGWGGSTKTAWYRIRSLLTLRPPCCSITASRTSSHARTRPRWPRGSSAISPTRSAV